MDAVWIRRMFAVMFAAFLSLFILVPLLSGYGEFTGLNGRAGYMDHFDLWLSKDPVTAFIYGFGDMVCHQSAGRSFTINGSQMPICARDTSIITGIFIGLLLFESKRIRARSLNRKMLLLAALLIFAAFAEWLSERLLHVNPADLRIITGVIAGIGVGILINAYVEHRFVKNLEKGLKKV